MVFLSIKGKDVEYNLIHLHQIIFEVTDACNLRCKYCGYADLYEGYDKRENLKFQYCESMITPKGNIFYARKERKAFATK